MQASISACFLTYEAVRLPRTQRPTLVSQPRSNGARRALYESRSWAAIFKNCCMRLVGSCEAFILAGLSQFAEIGRSVRDNEYICPLMRPHSLKRPLRDIQQPRRRCLGCGQMISQMAGQNTTDMAPYCAATMCLAFTFPVFLAFVPNSAGTLQEIICTS